MGRKKIIDPATHTRKNLYYKNSDWSQIQEIVRESGSTPSLVVGLAIKLFLSTHSTDPK